MQFNTIVIMNELLYVELSFPIAIKSLSRRANNKRKKKTTIAEEYKIKTRGKAISNIQVDCGHCQLEKVEAVKI